MLGSLVVGFEFLKSTLTYDERRLRQCPIVSVLGDAGVFEIPLSHVLKAF